MSNIIIQDATLFLQPQLPRSQFSSPPPSTRSKIKTELQRNSTASTRNSFGNSFEEQSVWDSGKCVEPYKPWSLLQNNLYNSKNRASLFIRTVRKFDSVKAIKALPLKSFIVTTSIQKMENRRSKSYYLGAVSYTHLTLPTICSV
eukprot:TRINITY_DN1442_c0_g1_i6.p1 TRINITY_DN1442_c0_g1~~TRINITY_DN1442_c0_g1_i6.p1  ORF type:complete len:145 (-),score=7.67 TRINITY_DN1442_c0_g1_i6:43-477(-)